MDNPNQDSSNSTSAEINELKEAIDAKLLCTVCHKRKAQKLYKGLCRPCYAAKVAVKIPKNLAEQVAKASSPGDWINLAKHLGPIVQGVADGSIKATAAQAGMLKEIMARAYGKPIAIQESKVIASGVIILPVLSKGEKMMVCPRCNYELTSDMENAVFDLKKEVNAGEATNPVDAQ